VKIQSNSSAEEKDAKSEWYVYIICCSDTSLYTGITTDVARRFAEHASHKGAKYFRARSPLEVVFVEGGHTRSSASQREAFVKKLSRSEKMVLIQSNTK
jgi:putative endonuclease